MKSLLLSLTIIISTFVLGSTNADIVKSSLNKDSVLLISEKASKIDCLTIQNNLPAKSENYLSEIIPIVTLMVGFFLGKVYDNWLNRKKTKSDGKDWIETFLQLQDPLEKQVDNISNFLKANPTNVNKIVNPEFQLSLDCNEFKALNDKSIIPYLRKQFKVEYAKSIKLAGQLRNTVRIIETSSILFNESFKELQNNSSVHFRNFTNDFPEFRKHLANYIDEILQLNDSSNEQKALANKIIELGSKYINPHLNSGTLNLFELSEQFFPQFLNASYDDRKHPEIIAAIESVTKCDQSIKNLMMERHYLREKQKNIKGSYERCIQLITMISDELKLNMHNSK